VNASAVRVRPAAVARVDLGIPKESGLCLAELRAVPEVPGGGCESLSTIEAAHRHLQLVFAASYSTERRTAWDAKAQ
jgi:hypothetical protein